MKTSGWKSKKVILKNTSKKIKITTMSNTKIPGLSFSWKRALGVTKAKREFTKATGIPTTKAGVERKIGGAILKALFGKK